MKPDPLVIAWQGRQLRVRHDDAHLGPYTPRGAVIRAAVELASDVEGLRLVLVSTLGAHYRVRASDDGSTVPLTALDRHDQAIDTTFSKGRSSG